MAIFDLFKKKKNEAEKKALTPQDIVRMAQMHEPVNIYDNGHLLPEVDRAVNEIMLYDGISNINMMLMMNNPDEMKQNMEKADVDTLLIFFKFLAIKASETSDNQMIGMVQHHLISVIQRKLS